MDKVMLVGTKEVLVNLLMGSLRNEYDVHSCDYSTSIFKRFMRMYQPKVVVCFKPMTDGADLLNELGREFPKTDFVVVLEKEDTQSKRQLDERMIKVSKPVKIDTLKNMVDECLGVEVHKKPAILAVDDSGMELRNIKQIIGNQYDLTFATSGDGALDLLEDRTFDLILLDYEMPMMSGPEVFKKILENHKTKDIPVVFLTGVSEKDKILGVIKDHPAGYLLKPIDSDLLLSTISGILEN